MESRDRRRRLVVAAILTIPACAGSQPDRDRQILVSAQPPAKSRSERLAEAKQLVNDAASAPTKAQRRDLLIQAVTVFPGANVPHFMLAKELAECGELSRAEHEYRLGLEIDPESQDGLVGLGDVLLWLGKWSDAARVFRRLSEGSDRYAPETVHFARQRLLVAELLLARAATSPDTVSSKSNASGIQVVSQPDSPGVPTPPTANGSSYGRRQKVTDLSTGMLQLASSLPSDSSDQRTAKACCYLLGICGMATSQSSEAKGSEMIEAFAFDIARYMARNNPQLQQALGFSGAALSSDATPPIGLDQITSLGTSGASAKVSPPAVTDETHDHWAVSKPTPLELRSGIWRVKTSGNLQYDNQEFLVHFEFSDSVLSMYMPDGKTRGCIRYCGIYDYAITGHQAKGSQMRDGEWESVLDFNDDWSHATGRIDFLGSGNILLYVSPRSISVVCSRVPDSK